jgi:hypothetical protein
MAGGFPVYGLDNALHCSERLRASVVSCQVSRDGPSPAQKRGIKEKQMGETCFHSKLT